MKEFATQNVVFRVVISHPDHHRIVVREKEIEEALKAFLPELLAKVLRVDECEVCGGVSKGVPGNENVIGGVVKCDYCHAKALKNRPWTVKEILEREG